MKRIDPTSGSFDRASTALRPSFHRHSPTFGHFMAGTSWPGKNAIVILPDYSTITRSLPHV